MELAHFESLYPPGTREKEIKKIIDFAKSGASCQLIALPGTGRSNVLELLSYNKGVREQHLKENTKWFHFVYMDCSEIKKRSLYDVTKFILISLSYSLSERKMEEEHKAVNELLKEAVSFQDELILFQSLKKAIDYLAIEKQLTIVFLFDRFDQYTPEITDQFFVNLKILRNRAKYRFSCVFSLARPLEDILETSVYADFYEFLIGNAVYLELYDQEGSNFRKAYLEKITGKTIEAKIDKEIIKLTGGHGKLTRIARESVIGEGAKDLEHFLFSKTHIQGALYEIWGSLLPDEQQALKATNKPASQDTKEPRISDYLKNVGLIKDGKLMIPLLEQFIHNLPATSETTITYDSARNEILKSGESITDLLSPSEFRLLRFLIQNADRVSEKDEIIGAVWKDTQTQEGVTDQALDQIIYRLRKKIETDPNNPRFIQTIKGRGYRFTK